ncbi:winged helix-turn-helix transcriptional regulator [Streptomyces sp. HM190]|uniref:winged helix-turn-helix transcriptional regulator n=1 Tax=Streptomyces sp. HM190 TaxID=2695266 RepID=UPI00135A9F99|nr:winged helix-turn-helix transcriptional regulator [Streptomyces sp. HM190]
MSISPPDRTVDQPVHLPVDRRSLASARRREGVLALSRAFDLLGPPGAGLIVAVLGQGPSDSAQLRNRLRGISDVELAIRLHDLIAAGLVKRIPATDASHGGRYALDEAGKALVIPLAGLLVWAEDHL